MSVHSYNIFISGAITTTDSDLAQVKFGLPGNVTVSTMVVNSQSDTTDDATIIVSKVSGGSTDASDITVTVSSGATFGEASGTITSNTSYYVKSGTPNGLFGINVTLNFER